MLKTMIPAVARLKQLAALAALAMVQACVSFPDAPPATTTPALAPKSFISIDGAVLGATAWRASEPQAVIVALHGMNDYSRAFDGPGAFWAAHSGITTYAIDQRGFGRSPNFGHWPGQETLMADLRAAIAAARAAHPDLPVFALGHSMGAAVILAAHASAPLDVDGVILAAPGVWGGPALPLPYRISLNLGAFLFPGKVLTGERAERQSTDNLETLRAMYYDPYVIKGTRLDSLLGVVRIMGNAYTGAKRVDGSVLFLIGQKDEIIPAKAMHKTACRLRGDVMIRRYQDGWHLLFRDLQAETVWRDVANWIDRQVDRDAPGGEIAYQGQCGIG